MTQRDDMAQYCPGCGKFLGISPTDHPVKNTSRELLVDRGKHIECPVTKLWYTVDWYNPAPVEKRAGR